MPRSSWLLLCAALASAAWAESDPAVAKYITKGDAYFKAYQFRLAAEAYKIALMHDPESQEAWEKHRQAFDRVKAIDLYLAKAQRLRREGRFEEAQDYLRQAVKMNPRSYQVWRQYERSLAENPEVVVIQSEKDAWDAYRQAKVRYEEGDLDAARRYLEEIYRFTQDPTLKYYAKSYLQKVQLKTKEARPSMRITVTDK
jgi:tetratricopeptide (TPR) repeat protein